MLTEPEQLPGFLCEISLRSNCTHVYCDDRHEIRGYVEAALPPFEH